MKKRGVLTNERKSGISEEGRGEETKSRKRKDRTTGRCRLRERVITSVEIYVILGPRGI